jgi:hypothetical protein
MTRTCIPAAVGGRGAVAAIVVVVAAISFARQLVTKPFGEARAGSDRLLARIDRRLLVLLAVTASTTPAAPTSTPAAARFESAAGHFVTDVGRLDVVFRIDIVGHHRHRRRRREAVPAVISPARVVRPPVIAWTARSSLIAMAAVVARIALVTLVARLSVLTLVARFAIVALISRLALV